MSEYFAFKDPLWFAALIVIGFDASRTMLAEENDEGESGQPLNRVDLLKPNVMDFVVNRPTDPIGCLQALSSRVLPSRALDLVSYAASEMSWLPSGVFRIMPPLPISR